MLLGMGVAVRLCDQVGRLAAVVLSGYVDRAFIMATRNRYLLLRLDLAGSRKGRGMTNMWAEELLSAINPAGTESEAFTRIVAAAQALGFEHCAFGLRASLPVTNPKILLRNNYPQAWQKRYEESGYIRIDPTVRHGISSPRQLAWNDEVFAAAPDLWAEAQSAGLRHGWCQSSFDASGLVSMLSLSRSSERITASELADKQMKMSWLVSIAHMALSRQLRPRLYGEATVNLTAREKDVLKWTVDGKTAGEIADILLISVDTVNFHFKNAALKMNTPNKATAAVRALVMGLLT